MAPSRQAGLTLIEVMIAVALFSLIGLAGFTLVQSIISVEERTDQRLDELSDLQRTMHLLTSDLERAKPDTLVFSGRAISFHREPEATGGAAMVIGYDLADKTLRRSILGQDNKIQAQSLVSDVDDIKWHFLLPSGSWVDSVPTGPDNETRPIAVALDIMLSKQRPGHGGLIRRIVALPRPPRL